MGVLDYIRWQSRERLLAGDMPYWIANSKRSKYIASVVLSAPPWVDRKELNLLQDEARRLTLVTGKQYVLDHIVPLNHPRVCGLTVPWNLQIILKTANDSKGNKWCPEQMDLF